MAIQKLVEKNNSLKESWSPKWVLSQPFLRDNNKYMGYQNKYMGYQIRLTGVFDRDTFGVN